MENSWSPISVYERIDDEKRTLLKRIITPILIILFGFGVMSLFVFFKKTPPKTEVKQVATLVDVLRLEQKAVAQRVSGFGTVRARQNVEVRPQVAGNIIEIHPRLQVGGRIPAGEILYKIDPKDFELAVKMKEAALARADFELKLEQGNQIVAKREWDLLESDLKTNEIGRTLALREPHLLEKKAALEAAKSDLEQAKLNLKRTEQRAPFDTVILSESADIGQYVSPQVTTAQIAATDEFQVEVRVSRASLTAIDIDDDGEPRQAVPATISQRLNSGETLVWEGRLIRVLSNVDDSGRMPRLLVGISAPLSTKNGRSPLLIGSYVKVDIEGKSAEGLYQIPRQALREGGVIWLVDDEKKLAIAPVELKFTQNNYAYIQGKITDGDLVVVSNLAQPLMGMLLELPE